MKLVNFLSYIGSLVSFYMFYVVFFLHNRGPRYYPLFVVVLLFLTFLVSYLASLVEARTTMAVLFTLLLVFVSLVITGGFSFLAFTHKAYFPRLFRISGAYIEFILLVILAYKWNKVR